MFWGPQVHSGGVEGFRFFLKILYRFVKNHKRLQKFSSKMSFFGFQTPYFLQNDILGGAFFKSKKAAKKFGGPHLAHGPHFGHVCYIG
jgi:hypothetical protein